MIDLRRMTLPVVTAGIGATRTTRVRDVQGLANFPIIDSESPERGIGTVSRTPSALLDGARRHCPGTIAYLFRAASAVGVCVNRPARIVRFFSYV